MRTSRECVHEGLRMVSTVNISLQDSLIQSPIAHACLVKQGVGPDHRGATGRVPFSQMQQKAEPASYASPPKGGGPCLGPAVWPSQLQLQARTWPLCRAVQASSLFYSQQVWHLCKLCCVGAIVCRLCCWLACIALEKVFCSSESCFVLVVCHGATETTTETNHLWTQMNRQCTYQAWHVLHNAAMYCRIPSEDLF